MTTRTVHENGAFASVRVVRTAQRPARTGMVAMAISLLACYGTLALIGILSALGVALSPDQTLVKSVIVASTLLATASVGFGVLRHGSALPLVIAACGEALLVTRVVFGVDRLLELLAFVLLAGAVYVDFRLRTRVRCAARGREDD